MVYYASALVTPIVLLHAVLVGVFAFAGIHHLYVWRLSRARLPLLIAVYATLSSLQMIGVMVLGSTNDLATAQIALDARSTFGISSTAVVAWVIAEFTKFRPTKFLLAVTIPPTVGVLVNLWVPIAGKRGRHQQGRDAVGRDDHRR